MLLMAVGVSTSSTVSSITASSNWGVTTSATPATAPNRTLTVPSGNPGDVKLNITSAPVSATLTYRRNSGTYTAFTDGQVITFNTLDTLNFRLAGASDSAQVTVVDNTTGATIGTSILTTT